MEKGGTGIIINNYNNNKDDKSVTVSDEKIKNFGESVGKRFDGAGTFNIGNLIQKRSFEVRTPETRIITDPETALRIKTKKIDGVTYILVPAGESMSINGVDITIKPNE